MRLELQIDLPHGPTADDSATDAFRSAVELHFRRIAEVINSNDGSPMIEEAATLPTASDEFHLRTMALKKDGTGEDTYWLCIQEDGGGYAWVLIYPMEDRWDDLRFPAQGINPPGAVSDPDIDTVTGMLLFAGTGNPEIIMGIAQLPHAWKEGSDIIPHIHWTKTTTGSTGNVNWTLEYEIENPGDVFPLTYSTSIDQDATVGGTPDNDTSGEHLISSFGAIDMTGFEISCCMLWKITRDPAHVDDTYAQDARLMEFDIHFELDSIGSEAEFVK